MNMKPITEMTRLTITAFLICMTFNGVTQEEVNYSKLRSLRDGESFIRFQVMDLNDSKKVKLENDMVYHWFKSQKVMSTQGGASGVLLDGIYEEFYPNSQLKTKGSFKKGIKHGNWRHWSKDGKLQKEIQWRKGKRVKEAIEYDTRGNVVKRKDFSADKTVYYEENKIIKTEKDSTEVEIIHKYENGQTEKVERFEDGRLEGKQVKYNSDGDMVYLKNYKAGKLHGKQIDKEGNKSYYKNGEPHTPLLKRLFQKKDDSEEEKSEESKKKSTTKKEETNE